MSYKVTVQPSGHQFRTAADEVVLEAGLREGIALPYGCRDGACGSCAARLLSGTIDYGGPLPPALGEAEAASGRVLLCQARACEDLVLEIREVGAARDIVVKLLPCRVAAMEKLADDVMRLQLQLPATERLQFLAGQYIDMILRDGRRRGFSLANPPHADEFLELHVRHVPGGRFTDQVFGDMKPRAILRFEGPMGGFYLREDEDRPLIMMAGGTGFAPLKSMIEHALYVDDPRSIHLYWGARAEADLYLDRLARDWAARHPRIDYTPVLSDCTDDQAPGIRHGLVHQAVCADYPDLSGHDVYMSGPPAMVDAARQAFGECRLPDRQLYFDAFEYSADTLNAIAEH